MDKFERDLMKVFNCNPEWPVCLYDFAFKIKNPTYFVLRVANNLNSFVQDGYFYGVNSQLQSEHDYFQPGLIVDLESNTKDLLMIERQHHLCCQKEFPWFVDNFK
jgi:hypothetical protein